VRLLHRYAVCITSQHQATLIGPVARDHRVAASAIWTELPQAPSCTDVYILCQRVSGAFRAPINANLSEGGEVQSQRAPIWSHHTVKTETPPLDIRLQCSRKWIMREAIFSYIHNYRPAIHMCEVSLPSKHCLRVDVMRATCQSTYTLKCRSVHRFCAGQTKYYLEVSLTAQLSADIVR
jgi:hypothetical protein